MKNPFFTLFCLLLLSSFTLSAQTIITSTPLPSPKAKVMQTVGVTDVSIVYSRPAVKGREIWGKLVPMNAVWRAGANDNTVIYFSKDVMVEGKALPAGQYGLHMIPTEKEWTVIFSRNSTAWGSFSYLPEEDALRVEVMPQAAGHFYEYLTYTFEPVDQGAAVCALHWGDKQVPFKIETDVHEQVMASLRKELQNKAGFTWQGWNEAANYALQNNVNTKEGLTWANRSVFMNPTPQNMIVKAQLTGKVKSPDDEKAALATTLETLEKDLAAYPVTWKEYQAAANFALQKENYEKAGAWADASIGMNANMTNLLAKARILEAKKDEKGAAKVKKEAIEKGSNAELNNYGYQLLFGANPEAAIEIFEANTKKHPEDPNVWDSLGEGYFVNGKKEKAIEAFKKSLSLNPPANVKANSMKFLEQMDVAVDQKP